MNKAYQVFYIIKRNRREELHHIFVFANNQNEAYKKCREIVYEKTGSYKNKDNAVRSAKSLKMVQSGKICVMKEKYKKINF